MKFSELLKWTGVNTLYFIAGFMCGTVVDILFAILYRRLDNTSKTYHRNLAIIIVLQLIVIVTMLSTILTLNDTDTYHHVRIFMLHFGVISSQFYLFDYISKYIGSFLMKYPDKFPSRPFRTLGHAKIFDNPE